MDELFNNAPCGFLAFADDGKIDEVNATLLALLGYEREELSGLHVEKIFPAAGRIFYQTHFFPLLKLKEKVEEIYLDLRSKTGESIPVLVNAARRERGGALFYDCIFVPMRQRNQYEDEILRAKKEAEAAVRAKDEFLSVVSHELRTPLSAILGWSKILRTKKLDDEAFAQATEAIERGAKTQSKLIEDILDFSRIISGKLRLEVQKIDLAAVIELAVDVVALSAKAKNIRLETILDSSGFVSGDSHRLQQVVWNLLTNAVKFTPKGGHVQIRLERVNSNVEISVSDTGKGISPEFLPYVFDRFRQADYLTTRRYGGLGLGLAITRHIVELHGGTVRAESPGENMGATFTVSLPVMIVHRKDDSALSTTGNPSPSEVKNAAFSRARQLKGFRVLVIDDEADSRDLLVTVLDLYGAQVSAAATVAEAVEKFESAKPDLVISDIGMPREDGFSLIKKLKAFNETRKRKIPAIALTAYTSQSDRLKILSAGFQMHLAKPIDPEELIVVIANLADLSEK